MTNGNSDNKIINKEDIGLEIIDYSILKLLSTGTWTISDMINLLQIRPSVIEKHIYELTRIGFVELKLQQFIITPKGTEILYSFERDSHIDIWKPVDNFIIQSIENRKKMKIKFYKMVDLMLLVLMVILIILIIYFGKDLL